MEEQIIFSRNDDWPICNMCAGSLQLWYFCWRGELETTELLPVTNEYSCIIYYSGFHNQIMCGSGLYMRNHFIFTLFFRQVLFSLVLPCSVVFDVSRDW